MEGNRLCSLCSASPAGHFCICSNLPLLCIFCRPTHEAKPGFHFPLPIAGIEHVTPQNQPQYRLWLVSLATSHEKLRENLLQIDKFREEIEAVCAHVHTELENTKGQMLRTLDQVKGILASKIDEAVKETSENAYLNYRPSTHLASLIWTHSSLNSSESVPAFTYQVTANLEFLPDLLSVSFDTPIPEIAKFNYSSKGRDLKQEISDLQEELRDLTARCHQLEAESTAVKSVSSHIEPSPVNNSLECIESEAFPDYTVKKRKRDGSTIPKTAVKLGKPDSPNPIRELCTVAKPAKEAERSGQKPHNTSVADSPVLHTADNTANCYSECQRCHQLYTDEDKDWKCPNHCHCNRCITALSASGSLDRCPHCQLSYSSTKPISNKTKEKLVCCSYCGLHLPKSQMITLQSHYCPLIPFDILENSRETVQFLWSKVGSQAYHCPACSVPISTHSGNKVRCCECSGVYRVSADVYSRIRETQETLQNRACCAFPIAQIHHKELICGHFVCEGHARVLRKCRICHKSAEYRKD